MTPEELFERAHNKDCLILDDPYVSDLKDKYENTALHILAKHGLSQVLEHYAVAQKRCQDKQGNTPLHHLAMAGCEKALEHPSAQIVKNFDGKTPKDVFGIFVMKVPEDFPETIEKHYPPMRGMGGRNWEFEEELLKDEIVQKCLKDENLHTYSKVPVDINYEASTSLIKNIDIQDCFLQTPLKPKPQLTCDTDKFIDHAINRRSFILSDHRVSKVQWVWGNTPLHILAAHGIADTMKHPDFTTVRNHIGRCPIHYLAIHFRKLVAHNSTYNFHNLRDNYNLTPSDLNHKYEDDLMKDKINYFNLLHLDVKTHRIGDTVLLEKHPPQNPTLKKLTTKEKITISLIKDISNRRIVEHYLSIN